MSKLDEVVEAISNLPKFRTVFIYLTDEEKVLIIEVQTNCDTPNNITVDKIVEKYMYYNYPITNYEVLDYEADRTVLKEDDIRGLPVE